MKYYTISRFQSGATYNVDDLVAYDGLGEGGGADAVGAELLGDQT